MKSTIIFYEEFLNYLSFEHIYQNKKEILKGFKTNTVGKNIKQLIIFFKKPGKKIVPELDTTGFKIPEKQSNTIYLTPKKINQILHVDLSEFPHLQKYRDLLVFCCLTGLKSSDFSVIHSEDLRDGMLL